MKNVNEEIKKALEGKTPHTNEWNVINQLLDLVEADREAKRIVSEDLENEELSIGKLVKTVLRGRPGPVEVMKRICDFYGLTCPNERRQRYGGERPSTHRNSRKIAAGDAEKEQKVAKAAKLLIVRVAEELEGTGI